jgi:hypothetical protein
MRRALRKSLDVKEDGFLSETRCESERRSRKSGVYKACMQQEVPHIATVDCIAPYLDSATQEEIRADHAKACHELHERFIAIAKTRGELDAAEADAIVEAHEIQIWRQYGMTNLTSYLEHVCGYAPRAANERERVARELVELPNLHEALSNGLHWTKVRELTRVATRATEAEWLEAARGKNVREIENLVSGHKKGDSPTDPAKPELAHKGMWIEMTSEQYARFRQTKAMLSDECGETLDDGMAIAIMARRAVEPLTGPTPMSPASRPAAQIAYTVCRNCQATTVDGAGIVVDVSAGSRECALCDAEDIGDLDAEVPARMSSTITPRMRRQVFARDHHRCIVPGCRASRCLDVHHLKHLEDGGTHEMSNLGLLCFAHHTLHHEGKLAIISEPGKLTFRRILDHGDRVEELGEYEMIDSQKTGDDFESDPRGAE